MKMNQAGSLILCAVTCCLALPIDDVDFHPGNVTVIFKDRGRELDVEMDYTATSRPIEVFVAVWYEGEVVEKNPDDEMFRNNRKMFSFWFPTSYRMSPNITIMFADKITYTYFFNPLPTDPSETLNESIPDLRSDTEVVYPDTGEASVDFVVSSRADDAVVDEQLTYTSYVKDGSFFYTSEDWPVTVTKAECSGVGVFRLEFNTSREQRPEGVLVLTARKEFRAEEGRQLIRAVEVVKRVDFYPEGSSSPVTPDTLAFVRQWTDTNGLSNQVCDISESQECTASCTVVGPKVSEIRLYKQMDYRERALPGSKTSTKLGFLNVTSASMTDVSSHTTVYLGCKARIGEGWDRMVEQRVVLTRKARAKIVEEVSSAWLYPNQTLEVRCKAQGVPVPTVTITDANDPEGRPLGDRFPSQSYTTMVEFFQYINVQFFLYNTAFTSSLSHVRCSADNGFKGPAVAVLEVVPPPN
ncbi:uncharacterized protein LOC143288858 [Babylonia areolata]|uniref:uncharacterized protein LOC143288858 n=1 Tax=Babylonia areolata TaxID=304850 RepID=UPI003FD37D02